MTSVETINMVRMMLDESRDDFASTAMIAKVINDAQMQKIREYYTQGNERLLRPIYCNETGLSDNTILLGCLVVSSPIAPFLYPRSCRIYNANARTASQTTALRSQTVTAKYLPNNVFFNYVNNSISPSTGFQQAYPGNSVTRDAYYTIEQTFTAGSTLRNDIIHFIGIGDQTQLADIWYIREPAVFTYDDTGLTTGTPLELPQECHAEIAITAAEIINLIDIGEQERVGVDMPTKLQ